VTPWLLACASGILLLLSFPPISVWPLAWIALAPLLAAARRAPDARAAANLGATAGLIFYASSMHWLWKVFYPHYMAIPFFALFSLWLALHCVLLWKASRRGFPDWAWIALSGAAMGGIEYFRAEVWWLHNSMLCLGYSQTASSPMLQACSVIGLYGLSSLIAAANGAAALAFERRWKPAAWAAAAAALLFLAGSWRVNRFQPGGRAASVAVVQDESYDLNKLAKLSLSDKQAQLLVWPEYSFTVNAGGEAAYQKLLAKRLEGLPAVRVLPGAIFPDDMKRGKEQNFAWVIGADGKLLGRFDKAHPIPFVETLLPANKDPKPVDTPLGRLGVEICYDLDFADTTRRLANLGAEVLVVPDLDPLEWGSWEHRQHSAMSAARAVESGLWIARAASSGESQIVDPVGRVVGSLPSGASATLSGTLRLGAARTPYAAFGWLWAPLCLALTIGAIGRILLVD
jgi:apolipoprotein N-acyltransferase